MVILEGWVLPYEQGTPASVGTPLCYYGLSYRRAYILSICGLFKKSLCNPLPTLEATQGQNDGFFSQLPYKCYLEEAASAGN